MVRKWHSCLWILHFLLLAPLTANAFTCDVATLAGVFSGVVTGTDTGAPYSEFMFVGVNEDGTVETFEVRGEPGHEADVVTGIGAWSFFDTTNCFALATVGGHYFIFNFADAGDMILFSTPVDPNLQAAGVLRRSGT